MDDINPVWICRENICLLSRQLSQATDRERGAMLTRLLALELSKLDQLTSIPNAGAYVLASQGAALP